METVGADGGKVNRNRRSGAVARQDQSGAAQAITRLPPLRIACPSCATLTPLHALHSDTVGGSVLRVRSCGSCGNSFTTCERALDSDSLPVPPGCPRWALRAAAAFLRVAAR